MDVTQCFLRFRWPMPRSICVYTASDGTFTWAQASRTYQLTCFPPPGLHMVRGTMTTSEIVVHSLLKNDHSLHNCPHVSAKVCDETKNEDHCNQFESVASNQRSTAHQDRVPTNRPNRQVGRAKTRSLMSLKSCF